MSEIGSPPTVGGVPMTPNEEAAFTEAFAAAISTAMLGQLMLQDQVFNPGKEAIQEAQAE